MTSISAYFFGAPNDSHDRACREIFEARGAKFIGAGTMFLGPRSGERDQQWDVADRRAAGVRAALTKAGFRLSPTPIGDTV